MNILGRPSLRPINRARHRLWAINLVAMATIAEQEGRAPPAPLRAKAFRANPLWLERAMRADPEGKLLESAERPQSFIGVLRYGANPTQCYERLPPRLVKRHARSAESPKVPSRRGPAKGELYDRATFSLVDRGEVLLPGSRRMMDADLWNLLQDTPRTLYDTHLAVQKLLLQFGLVRVTQPHVEAIGRDRLTKLRGMSTTTSYHRQLVQLLDDHPKFDIDVLSLLANLVHESFLMGNRELHELHLLAFASHYGKLEALSLDPDISFHLNFAIQQKIIDQDWWHAGYKHWFSPIDKSQLLLAKGDWDALKEERPELAQTMGWLRLRLER